MLRARGEREVQVRQNAQPLSFTCLVWTGTGSAKVLGQVSSKFHSVLKGESEPIQLGRDSTRGKVGKSASWSGWLGFGPAEVGEGAPER